MSSSSGTNRTAISAQYKDEDQRIICAVALLCRVLLSRGGNSGNGKQGLMAERAANYVQELEQGINQSSLAPSARFLNASIAVYLQEHRDRNLTSISPEIKLLDGIPRSPSQQNGGGGGGGDGGGGGGGSSNRNLKTLFQRLLRLLLQALALIAAFDSVTKHVILTTVWNLWTMWDALENCLVRNTKKSSTSGKEIERHGARVWRKWLRTACLCSLVFSKWALPGAGLHEVQDGCFRCSCPLFFAYLPLRSSS